MTDLFILNHETNASDSELKNSGDIHTKPVPKVSMTMAGSTKIVTISGRIHSTVFLSCHASDRHQSVAVSCE